MPVLYSISYSYVNKYIMASGKLVLIEKLNIEMLFLKLWLIKNKISKWHKKVSPSITEVIQFKEICVTSIFIKTYSTFKHFKFLLLNGSLF